MSQSYHNVRNNTGVNNISRRVCFLSFPTFILAYRGSCRFRAGKVHVLPTMSYVVTEEPFPEKRTLKFHGLFICFCTFLAKPFFFFFTGFKGDFWERRREVMIHPGICVCACMCLCSQTKRAEKTRRCSWVGELDLQFEYIAPVRVAKKGSDASVCSSNYCRLPSSLTLSQLLSVF